MTAADCSTKLFRIVTKGDDFRTNTYPLRRRFEGADGLSLRFVVPLRTAPRTVPPLRRQRIRYNATMGFEEALGLFVFGFVGSVFVVLIVYSGFLLRIL